MVKACYTYYKFVPRQIVRMLNAKKISDIALGLNTSVDVMLLSSDIRSFTTISESLTSEEIFNLLALYYQAIAPIIRDAGGFIVKYLGDGIIAMFPEKTDGVLKCAIKMQSKLEELRRNFKAEGKPELFAGIGIHYGCVDLGIIGSESRLDAVAVSESIQEVVEIENNTKKVKTDILISEDAIIFCKENNHYAYESEVTDINGKNMTLYKIVGRDK